LWQRGDTRSLERAFDTLRRQTLAFHRCGVRITDGDNAVARCESVATASATEGTPGSRATTWTIAFRRTAGRWMIANVTMR
jgi:ketosteroid isomerase-like protein